MNIDSFNIENNIKNIEEIEKQNRLLIKSEKKERENFLNGLNLSYNIVLIGSGESLNEKINREVVKKKFNNLSDNFYIVPINDKWIFCDEYDFCFCLDESIVYHYVKYNNTSKKMLTSPYSYRIDYETKNNVVGIPYKYYKDKKNNLLCTFKVGSYRIRNYIYNDIEDLLQIEIYNGGSASISFFSKIGFKNIYLIGFGGTGHTNLKSTIPMSMGTGSWIGNNPKENKNHTFQYLKSDRNNNNEYEKEYNKLEIKNNIKLYIY